MIGNDIVDLSLAAVQSNWQHPRFLDKVFSRSEQEIISDSSDRFSMIWRLWATKEAAYKAYTQSAPGRFFKPKSFQCSLRSGSIEVRYEDFNIEVISVLNGSMLFAESISNNETLRKIIEIPAESKRDQSNLLRKALYFEVSKSLDIPHKLIGLKKDQYGIPSLFHNDNKLKVSLSLTHHGSYTAYSIVYL